MATLLSSHEVLLGQLNAIVPRIAELMCGSVAADHCGLFVYDETRTSTIALYRYAYNDQMHDSHSWTDPLAPTEIPAEAEVIRTGRPLQRRFPEDADRWPLVNPGQELEEGRYRDLVLPLLWREEVLGVGYIWRSHDPSPYSEAEVEAALDVARMAGMAIMFARQHEHEHLARERLDTLLDVATVSSSAHNIDEVLQALASAVRRATEADICNLYVYDERADSILVAFTDGLTHDEHEMFVGSQQPPPSVVPVEVRMQRSLEPVVLTDYYRELTSVTPLTEYLVQAGVSEVLAVPIVYQERMIGVLYAWYRDSKRTFSETEIDTVKAIADQAAGVVSRARMQEATEQQAAEREALLRIGQAVLNADSLEPVLDEIAGALSQLVQYDYAYIGLLTEDQSSITVVREWGTGHQPILHMNIPVDESLSGMAVRTGNVISSSDVLQDRRAWKQDPKSPPIRSVIAAPLVTEQGKIGTLFVGCEDDHAFARRQERLMMLLSQQAAVAIERVQAREALANRASRSALLSSVVNLLVTTDDPVSALGDIAKLASGVIADGVVIGLADWEFGAIRWTAHASSDPDMGQALARGLDDLDVESLSHRIEEILVSNQERLFNPGDISSEHDSLLRLAERVNVDQFLAIPLFQQERARGMMILLTGSGSPRFTAEVIELGRILAHRIGDALEQYQLKRNQEAMLRVSEAMHGQSDIESLLRILTTELEAILPCDHLYIGELEEGANVLRPHFNRYYRVEYSNKGEIPANIGVCSEALRTGLPIMDNEADQRETTIYHDPNAAEVLRQHGESVLVAPLIAEDDVIGVLFVSRIGNHRFTTADLETFLLFAGLAGSALDRTGLLQQNRELYQASVEVLAAVVDAKDPMTLEHSRHVAFYSHLAAELMELPAEEVERIELAGLLHDIGKLSIPDHVLRKPERLDDEELALIRTHPDRGGQILERHPALTELVPLVRHHHEWFDGRGYPAGLTGAETPLGASIICVADAFDTMTSERTYQYRKQPEEAMRELERNSGTQFHPEVVRRFVAALRADPALIYEPAVLR